MSQECHDHRERRNEQCHQHGHQHRDRHHEHHRRQRHDHECQGSVELAEKGCARRERHNHRFCTISSDAIPMPCGSHRHDLCVNTDFFDDHHHRINIETGPAICVGHGKHVHFAKGHTTCEDGHSHEFQVVVLIEDPLVQDCKRRNRHEHKQW